jgi:hypothetical protein
MGLLEVGCRPQHKIGNGAGQVEWVTSLCSVHLGPSAPVWVRDCFSHSASAELLNFFINVVSGCISPSSDDFLGVKY